MLSENTTTPESAGARTTTLAGAGLGSLRTLMAPVFEAFDRHLSNWLLPVLIVASWQLAVHYGLIPERILPAPLAIVRAAIIPGTAHAKHDSSGTKLRP